MALTPNQNLLVSVAVVTLVFIIVSLSSTYNITHKLFGSFVHQTNQYDYGTGLTLHNRGFLLHVIVFFAAVYALAYYVNMKRGAL